MSNHSFDIHVATEYNSVEVAIMVWHFQYWIMKNKALKRNLHEGRTWSYQTIQEVAACFPYWSFSQVKRILAKLIEHKILIKGNFNKTPLDRTVWYAFDDEEKFMISRIREMHFPNSENGDDGIGKCYKDTDTLPDTLTNRERERKSAPARPSSSEKSKERAPNVFLSDSEHDKLIAVYAAQKTAALYRILSEWKEDTPKSKWKKNDYRSILRWVVQAESERFQKGISSSENNIALASTVIKKFSYRMDIQFSEHNGKKYMEFIKGAHSKIIYLDDIDFEEKVLKELKDRDLKMETQ